MSRLSQVRDLHAQILARVADLKYNAAKVAKDKEGAVRQRFRGRLAEIEAELSVERKREPDSDTLNLVKTYKQKSIQLDLIKGRCQAMHTENDALKAAIDDARAEIQAREQDSDIAREEIDESGRRIKHLQTEVEQLLASLASVEAETEEQEEEARQRAEPTLTAEEMAGMEKSRAIADALRAEGRKLRLQVETSRRHTADMRSELTASIADRNRIAEIVAGCLKSVKRDVGSVDLGNKDRKSRAAFVRELMGQQEMFDALQRVLGRPISVSQLDPFVNT
ncbi:hypothetical protein KIPB_004984 [Kipferlia bialata]|uniref:Uncharacterized protein n=1 Tax=Kipferlia bialata TaxID=797122 RepID=A0A9K3CWJ7_9EUKA|nr:hypothetical protein KIPB_004984 [Kipferlia bialata]|eukprot:g4984.t1